MAAAGVAHGQGFPADAGWHALDRGGEPVDDAPFDGRGLGRELVGNSIYPAVYVASDPGTLHVRLRLDSSPLQDGMLRPFAWGLELDTDDDLADHEYLIVLDGAAGELRLRRNSMPEGTGDPSDPAEDVVFATPIVLDTNARVRAAAFPAPPSSFGGTGDAFVDFSIPWSALRAAGLARTCRVRLVAGTSNVGSRLTVDLADTTRRPAAGALADAASDRVPLGLVESADTDGDGLLDDDEDVDRDCTRDPDETDPTNPDSDGGGVSDGDERDAGTDPLDPSDDTAPPESGGEGGVLDPGGCSDTGDPCDGASFHVSGGGCRTGGPLGPGTLAIVLAVFGVFGARRRARGATLVLAVCAAGRVDPAHAQGSTELAVDRFRLATDAGGILDVEGAEITAGTWDLALAFGLADDELVLEDDQGERVGSLVDHRVGAYVGAAFAPRAWLQLAAALPIAFVQSSDAPMAAGFGPVERTAVGDLRLAPKLAVFNARRHAVSVAVVAALSLPTATTASFVGERAIVFAPELAASRSLGRLRLAANLGIRLRERVEVGDLRADDEVHARLGIAYRLEALALARTEVAVTTSVATPARDVLARDHDVQWEILGGAQHDLGRGLTLFAAGGAGLDRGFGTADWRVVIGTRLRRAPAPRRPAPTAVAPQVPADHDADALDDDADACPLEAEDRDGFEDDDGCPDPGSPGAAG